MIVTIRFTHLARLAQWGRARAVLTAAVTIVMLGAGLLAGHPAEAASTRANAKQHAVTRHHAAPQHAARRGSAAGKTASRKALPAGQKAQRSARNRPSAAHARTARNGAAHAGKTKHQQARRGVQHRTRYAAAGSSRRGGGWQAGLPPVSNMEAASCPDGTVPTLARGHTNVTRCMPM